MLRSAPSLCKAVESIPQSDGIKRKEYYDEWF